MADLIDTTEMYLRTILELEEEGIVPLRARISERLGHSGPTVSQTIGRMERDGLVVVTDERRLEFTAEGRLKAVRVMRKHRLAERLLADVIGLEWEYVHEEACRWEHVMSERVERKLLDILEHPTESPYGNPIPGLDELGVVTPRRFSSEARGLTELLPGDAGGGRFRVQRFAEAIQVDPELLAQLADAGVLPGVDAQCESMGEFIRIEVHGVAGAIEVARDAAAHIFVSELPHMLQV